MPFLAAACIECGVTASHLCELLTAYCKELSLNPSGYIMIYIMRPVPLLSVICVARTESPLEDSDDNKSTQAHPLLEEL